MQNFKDLQLLTDSSVPFIIIESHEENRLLGLFDRLIKHITKPLYKWSATEGLKRLDVELKSQFYNSKPVELLNQIKMTSLPGIYILLDFHPYLDDPIHIRMLKDIAVKHTEVPHSIVMISHELRIPEELERYSARFDLSLPDRTQLEKLIRDEAKRWSKRNRDLRISTKKKILDQLVNNLLGLPVDDAKRLIAQAIQDDNVVDEADLTAVMQAKFEILSQGGVLSFEYDTSKFADVGGLDNLKQWLMIRKNAFVGNIDTPGLHPPKGIMLLGVQGCGKSLAAKAVSGAWGVPLLRMDFGSIYNKFYGESEKNIRESLKTAEVMAPCVLWIDEIEKGISVESNDGGTSRRILGTLLTWMAENREKVFIVATANDIQALPPELIRKGRLDEIFFVDLPDEKTRRIIIGIHLSSRDMEPEDFDLDILVDNSLGFSGSEIEQAIVSALYSAYAKDKKLETEDIVNELNKTQPLSVLMAEKVRQLQDWAKDRTVSAN